MQHRSCPDWCSDQSDAISSTVSSLWVKGRSSSIHTHKKEREKNLPIEVVPGCDPADSCASMGFAAGDEFFRFSCCPTYFKLANVLSISITTRRVQQRDCSNSVII